MYRIRHDRVLRRFAGRATIAPVLRQQNRASDPPVGRHDRVLIVNEFGVAVKEHDHGMRPVRSSRSGREKPRFHTAAAVERQRHNHRIGVRRARKRLPRHVGGEEHSVLEEVEDYAPGDVGNYHVPHDPEPEPPWALSREERCRHPIVL